MSRVFSLAGLLRVRGVQEREAAARLSRAAVEASQTQARERQLRAALGASSGAVAQDGRSLAAHAAARAAARSLLAELQNLSQLQQHAFDDAKAAHSARRREVRGLEKLAAAHALQLRADDLRAEQFELDEIASRTGGES